MKRNTQWFAILFITALCSCQNNPELDLSQNVFIPLPAYLEATGSSFELDAETKINTGGESLSNLVKQTRNLLSPATGFDLDIADSDNIRNNQIVLRVREDMSKVKGTYRLEINPNNILIEGADESGVYFGLQTLMQVFPNDIVSKTDLPGIKWYAASGIIEDNPRYQHRGAMLDVARHFFSVEDVKSYIDYLAMYKMNVFHMHLSDDQGWRLEIKSWPKLTEVGSVSEVGGGAGGFYTQEEFIDIIQYANNRYIDVIPEFDIPGHINAALHAYPILNPKDEELPYYTGMEVGFSTLDYKDPDTWIFIEDLIREIAAISPSPYIHIGGDETHATSPKDYRKFIPRIVAIVEKNGKSAMGWADIAEAELTNQTVAQFWKPDAKNVRMAVDQGVKIIMSPATKAYLDQKYNEDSRIGLKWASMIEIDAAYEWNPSTYLENVDESQILGMEAALWTETVENIDDLQWLVFPRLVGYGEVSWSKENLRSWEDYKPRLKSHLNRLDLMGINYYKSPLLEEDVLKK
jgi:hexosaminidase